jgi:hypothetical protein
MHSTVKQNGKASSKCAGPDPHKHQMDLSNEQWVIMEQVTNTVMEGMERTALIRELERNAYACMVPVRVEVWIGSAIQVQVHETGSS